MKTLNINTSSTQKSKNIDSNLLKLGVHLIKNQGQNPKTKAA